MKLATKSTGRAGEEAAQWWFKAHGWRMHKIEPPVKNLGPVPGKPGQFKAVYTEAGMPDFFGFRQNDSRLGNFWSNLIPTYVEAKEAHGMTWPASKLSVEQRAFLADLPNGTGHVFILWRDGIGEMFPFIARGSYKKGEGLNK